MSKVLTIRQPWAWAIIYAGKDIENRSWSTDFRGPLLIHAASTMTEREYERAKDYILKRFPFVPNYDEFVLGAIIGQVRLIDCVRENYSPWFEGEFGWVLKNPEPITPVYCKGQLRLWNYEI